MILEMHCHTTEHSACSTVSAADLVQSNFEKGLQGTVLTDHHYLWSADEIRELRSRLKVPAFYIILSGQEVETRELGHVLVYGADISLERGISVAAIRQRFPDAALVWAHPYRDQHIPPPEKLTHPLTDGIEIFTSNHTVTENNAALRDWHEHKFTALSGTDTHAVSYSALYPTLFDHPIVTIQELAAEIRAGRCRPFFEEVPHSGTSSTKVIEITIGTKGRSETPDKFVVRSHRDAAKWHSAEQSVRIIEEIERHGFDSGRFRVPKQFGHDDKNFTVIEQGIRGKTLFDKLVESGREDARRYLEMTAEWLAKLHNLRLQVTPPDHFLRTEPDHLAFYLSAFYESSHPHTRRAQEIMDIVTATEAALYGNHPEKMVQGHGDFHPKNIFIGRDRNGDVSSTFIAAIDFNSSSSMPPAYDVGTFLAQFRNQFYDNKKVTDKVSPTIFLDSYLEHSDETDIDFLSQVELFKARTSLSICYHFIKIGLGMSDNLWRVLIEAGQSLARLSVKSMVKTPVIEQTEDQRKLG